MRYFACVVLVTLLTLTGVTVGWVMPLHRSSGFRATVQFLVKSVGPDADEAMTSREIVNATMQSEVVTRAVFNSPEFQPFRSAFEDRLEIFRQASQELLVVELDDSDAQAKLLDIHFDHANPELCIAAARSFARAMEAQFDAQNQSTADEFANHLQRAMDRLLPTIKSLERRFFEFRGDAPLSLSADGTAVNPHHDQIKELQEQRNASLRTLRREEMLLSAMEAVIDQTDEPQIALMIVAQLINAQPGQMTRLKESPEKAEESLDELLQGTRVAVQALQASLAALDKAIEKEKQQAKRVSIYERDYEKMKRELERHEQLLAQLEEALAKASLQTEENGTTLSRLQDAREAYRPRFPPFQLAIAGGTLAFLFANGLSLLVLLLLPSRSKPSTA